MSVAKRSVRVPISAVGTPDRNSGSRTSVRHQSDSVSATRRMPSPATRRAPFDRGRPDPGRDEDLEIRDDPQLVLPQVAVGVGLGRAGRLADDEQELDRDARPVGQLTERLGGIAGEPVVARLIDEVERQVTGLQRLGEDRQGDAARLEALHDPDPPHIAGLVHAIGSGDPVAQDAELDQPVHIGHVDPGPLGQLPPSILLHGTTAWASRDRAVNGSDARRRSLWHNPAVDRRIGLAAAGLIVVALLAVGPLGLLGSSPGRSATPSPSSGRVLQPSAAVASPVAGGSPSPPPASTPSGPTPSAPLADVPVVPVTNFRATPTSTDLTEVKAIAGRDQRPLHGGRARRRRGRCDPGGPRASPGRPTARRLILAASEAALAADLTKNRKRLAFLRADAVGPEVRALDWGDAALFGVDRVKDLADWPLTARLPAAAAGTAYDPATTWTLFAGGDIMLDRGVYETLHVKGKGADFPFDGGTADITGRCKDCSPLGWDTAVHEADRQRRRVPRPRSRAPTSPSPTSRTRPRTTRSWHTKGTVFSADPRLIDGLARRRHRLRLAGQQPHPRRRRERPAPDDHQRQEARHQGARAPARTSPRPATPAILEAAGTKVAILGYDAIAGGYHATATKVGSAPLSAKAVKADVAQARTAGADLVIVFPHWGTEYDPTPFVNQKKLAG